MHIGQKEVRIQLRIGQKEVRTQLRIGTEKSRLREPAFFYVVILKIIMQESAEELQQARSLQPVLPQDLYREW